MQSAGRLLAAAGRCGLSVTRWVTPLKTFPAPPVCLRCGRSVRDASIALTPVRHFARKAKQTSETQPKQRASRRLPSSNGSSSQIRSDGPDNKQRPVDESGADSNSRDALMRLVAQMPAADVPAAIAALNQRLSEHKQITTPNTQPMAVLRAEADMREDEVEKMDEDHEDEEEEGDEDDAEYAALRERLEKEGVVRTEAGEEIMSMEEVERQLREGGGPEDENEEEFVLAEEDDGEEAEVSEQDEEEDSWQEEDEELQHSAASAAPRSPASSSAANTFWIQEHRDGTVTVTEWPFADDDDTDTDLADTYDLNMPHGAAQQPASVVGQLIGGEKLKRADVLELREKDLHEHFTKGGGRGGQKVNKTSNCVHLHHLPTGTIVKCHATRSLAENRRIARQIMQDRLEELVLGPASKNAQRAAKIRKQKAKTRRRAAVKYGDMEEEAGDSETVDGAATVVKQQSSSRAGGDK